MEQIIFYLLIFSIGTLFGSFFTLAVYRIPLHEDITHKRSYCPNCNHKLSFWDMIPILSYLFLGGKCRYCKQKIRIRYLLLEIGTGMIFLLFAMSLNLSFVSLEQNKLIYLIFGILYIAGLIIIAGIDREKHKIEKSVIIYEFIMIIGYMVYLYTVEKTNIYRYAIYLFLLFVFLIIDNTYLKKKLNTHYPTEILELSMIMAIFGGEMTYIASVILCFFTIAIEKIERSILTRKNRVAKREEMYYKNLSFGFYLSLSNIISLIIINGIACRW